MLILSSQPDHLVQIYKPKNRVFKDSSIIALSPCQLVAFVNRNHIICYESQKVLRCHDEWHFKYNSKYQVQYTHRHAIIFLMQ
jgi:hypothetical protein